MISIETVRQMALAFPGAEEKDHFGMPSFRVKNKIFCTIHVKHEKVMVKLSLIDQSVFCQLDKNTIYPVPGGWGRQGSTFIELRKVMKSILKDALTKAFTRVTSKRSK
jgi:hypothetical protein